RVDGGEMDCLGNRHTASVGGDQRLAFPRHLGGDPVEEDCPVLDPRAPKLPRRMIRLCSLPNDLMAVTTLHTDLGEENADLTSHDAFVRAVPHATFARMRREKPVAWVEEGGGG